MFSFSFSFSNGDEIMTTIDSAARGRDGRFTPGHSGNPKGKPPGTRNRATVLRELLFEGQEFELVQAAVASALQGDKVGQRQFMGFLYAKPRGRFLDLPDVLEGSQGKALGVVRRGLSGGAITTEEAFGIARLLEAEAQALATEAGGRRSDAPAEEPSPSRELRSRAPSSPAERERSEQREEEAVTAEAPDLNSTCISQDAVPAPARPPEVAALLDSVRKAAAAAAEGTPLSRPMRRALLNSACKSAALVGRTPAERAEIKAEIKKILRAGVDASAPADASTDEATAPEVSGPLPLAA
jgi:hypothetical protein